MSSRAPRRRRFGFCRGIDVHSHADSGLLDPELRLNRGFVTQGVTTCVFGVDGGLSLESIRHATEVFGRQGVGTNYAFYIGHNGVRRQVMGMEARPPTEEEMAEMKALVERAMEAGMLGLSATPRRQRSEISLLEERIEPPIGS